MKHTLLALIVLTLTLSACNTVNQDKQPLGMVITADGQFTLANAIGFTVDTLGFLSAESTLTNCKLIVADVSKPSSPRTLAVFSYVNQNAQINLANVPIMPTQAVSVMFNYGAGVAISNTAARVAPLAIIASKASGQKIDQLVMANMSLNRPEYTQKVQIIYCTEPTTITGTVESENNKIELNVELREGYNSIIFANTKTANGTNTKILANSYSTEELRWMVESSLNYRLPASAK